MIKPALKSFLLLLVLLLGVLGQSANLCFKYSDASIVKQANLVSSQYHKEVAPVVLFHNIRQEISLGIPLFLGEDKDDDLISFERIVYHIVTFSNNTGKYLFSTEIMQTLCCHNYLLSSSLRHIMLQVFRI